MNKTYSTNEVADKLGMDKKTVHRWVASKRLKKKVVGRNWRYEQSVIDELSSSFPEGLLVGEVVKRLGKTKRQVGYMRLKGRLLVRKHPINKWWIYDAQVVEEYLNSLTK